jgi:hypothetical protein
MSVEMTAAATSKYNEHQDKMDLLGEQHGIDDAILAWPVGNHGISQFRLDDSALGEDVSPHVMQIGLVVLYGLDLDGLGFARLGIGDCSHVAPQHSHLLISTLRLDLLSANGGYCGVALLSAVLMLSLAPCRNQFPAGGLSSKFALPTHILIPQIASSLWGTVFNGCGA